MASTSWSCAYAAADAAPARIDRLIRPALVLILAATIGARASAYEGYADALTTGGEGGAEVWVTTLADSGAGSLREVVKRLSGSPTTIRFAVAGTICVGSEIRITQSSVTIAGESAPPPGITLDCAFSADRCLGINADDVIVRHLRIRNSPLENIQIWGGERIIVDHCSLTWAGDGAVDINTGRVTVSRSLIAGNVEASKAHGDRVSFHHNLFTDNNRRQARIFDPAGPDFDFRNNYVTNWWNLGTQVVGAGASCNIINNFYGPPAPGENWSAALVPDGAGPFHTAGNVASDPEAIDVNALGTAAVPFAEPDVTTLPAEDVPADVLADVGAQPTDAIDQGWIDGTLTGYRTPDWTPPSAPCAGSRRGPVPEWSEAADWYVDQGSGDDDNPGSAKRPFASIARAIAAARAGDLVLVGAGTYVGQLAFTDRGGKPGAPIAFKRDLRAGPARITAGRENVSSIYGTVGYVTLDGFEITGGKIGIRLYGEAADGWVIKNCLVFDNAQDGIQIRYGDNTMVYNCAVYDNGARGVYAFSSALNTAVRQSTIYDHKYNVYFTSSSSGEVGNSIVNVGVVGVYAKSATVNVVRSNVNGHAADYLYAHPGAGSISVNPGFLAPARGDFRRRATGARGGDMGYRYGRF